ncbi:MAG TPA: hypothetical protein VMY77_08570 [Chitinophagaceae bacterium]|nr:hypothetical protein [Chitinophagaceae bacterium]
MEDKTIRELLPAFYKQYNLGMDGGQSSSSVKVELTKKLILYIPNFTARRKAVLKHDIHHIVTGYPSTFKGESEIGAWEISSGCRHYWAAWVLDASGFMSGILFNPRGVLKAFARGRRTRNLYFDKIADEKALDMKQREIQKVLLLDKYQQNTTPSFNDIIVFSFYALAGLIYSVLSLLLIPFILIYTAYIKLK